MPGNCFSADAADIATKVSFNELSCLWRSCSFLARFESTGSLIFARAVLCAKAFCTTLPLAKSANINACVAGPAEFSGFALNKVFIYDSITLEKRS